MMLYLYCHFMTSKGNFIFPLQFKCNTGRYSITLNVARQLRLFREHAPDAFNAAIKPDSVVFSKSRSKAFWADTKIRSKVSRIQWPTGQAALGLRLGVPKGSSSSTAL